MIEVTDRSYWEKRATKQTVSLVDDLFDIVKSFDDNLELKYNKFYVGITKNGQPDNFILFRPKKKFVRIDLRISKDKSIEEKIEENELDIMDYSRSGRMRIKITKEDIKEKSVFLTELIEKAYKLSVV
jgi:predicted transport protein